MPLKNSRENYKLILRKSNLSIQFLFKKIITWTIIIEYVPNMIHTCSTYEMVLENSQPKPLPKNWSENFSADPHNIYIIWTKYEKVSSKKNEGIK